MNQIKNNCDDDTFEDILHGLFDTSDQINNDVDWTLGNPMAMEKGGSGQTRGMELSSNINLDQVDLLFSLFSFFSKLSNIFKTGNAEQHNKW